MPGRNIEENEIAAIAQMIRDYLRSHPKAADTEGGITWWLTRQCYLEIAPKVPQALAYLVEQGLINMQPLADGRVRYYAKVSDRTEND